MTDKRFTVGKKNNKWYIQDNWEDIRYNDMILPNDISKVCMILNELHEENNGLKCESKMVYERNAYKKLYDEFKQENEQLKSKVDYLERKIARERVSSMKQQEKWEKEAKETIEKLQHRIQTYKSANELLKKTLEDHKCQNTN